MRSTRSYPETRHARTRRKEYVAIADDKLDLAAAALDLATNTFEQIGKQRVIRRVVARAYGEI